jgi:hypothetical protein
MVAYETFKEAVYEGRLRWKAYEPLLREVSRLQVVKGKRVDHPSGGSKDVADAVAGAVYNAVSGVGGARIDWL